MPFVKKFLTSPWSILAIRIVIGGLFVYAGTTKIFEPRAFARTISHWGLAPEPLLPVLAIGLPILEILGGLALFFGHPLGIPVITGLLVFFVGVLGYGMGQGLEVECGCFGSEDTAFRNSLAHAFYRDLVLLAGILYLYYRRVTRRRRNTLENERP
jgi:uncharacterized membrane protein YphA (DoxX/SURF4 family)